MTQVKKKRNWGATNWRKNAEKERESQKTKEKKKKVVEMGKLASLIALRHSKPYAKAKNITPPSPTAPTHRSLSPHPYDSGKE